MSRKDKILTNNFKLALFSFVSIIVIFLLLITNGFSKSMNTYVPITSETLDMKILVPEKSTVTERLGTIKIVIDNKEISIDRYGSFFNNLDDHIKDLSKKNNVDIEILEKIPSERYQIYKLKFNTDNQTTYLKTNYLILVGYSIYSFSTNSEELFPEIEKIVKSFEYIPENP